MLFETHDLLRIPTIFNQREVILATFGLSRIPVNNICVSRLSEISGGSDRKKAEKFWKKPFQFLTKTENQMLNHVKSANRNEQSDLLRPVRSRFCRHCIVHIPQGHTRLSKVILEITQGHCRSFRSFCVILGHSLGHKYAFTV